MLQSGGVIRPLGGQVQPGLSVPQLQEAPWSLRLTALPPPRHPRHPSPFPSPKSLRDALGGRVDPAAPPCWACLLRDDLSPGCAA